MSKKESGLDLGRPVVGAGALDDIGDLPSGGILKQVGNSCGTCSLSAVLRHYGIGTTQRELDLEIRNANIFTAPPMLMRCARGRGFEAVFRNCGNVDEVKEFIDRDIPVILQVNCRPGEPWNPLHLHYVVAIAYREDDGFHIGIYNPHGLREEITEDELTNIWEDVHLGPVPIWDRAFVVVAPAGTDVGASRPSGARGINMLGLGVGDMVNGITHILRDRHILKGFRELAVALPESFIGFSLFLLEKLIDTARRGRR